MQAVFPSRRDMNMHAVRLPHPAELIRDEGTAVEYNIPRQSLSLGRREDGGCISSGGEPEEAALKAQKGRRGRRSAPEYRPERKRSPVCSLKVNPSNASGH